MSSRNKLRSRKRSIELSIIQFTTNTPLGLMPFNMLIDPAGEALRDMTATRICIRSKHSCFQRCIIPLRCVVSIQGVDVCFR